MFLILEEYAPTLVPYSIDEGFMDFSTMDTHVWRNATPTDYVQGIPDYEIISADWTSGPKKAACQYWESGRRCMLAVALLILLLT